MSQITGTTPAIHGLVFTKAAPFELHESMLRTEEKIELNEKPAPDEIAHRKAGARRTAWIIGALALAFFLASLVEGHLSHIPH